MSVAVDVFNTVASWAGVIWDVVRPYKEAIFGLCVVTGGGLAAFKGGYQRQARRPEEALSEAASRSQTVRVTVTRLHSDDRELIENARDSMLGLTRAAKHLTTALQDQVDVCTRSGRGGGSGSGGGVGRNAEATP